MHGKLAYSNENRADLEMHTTEATGSELVGQSTRSRQSRYAFIVLHQRGNDSARVYCTGSHRGIDARKHTMGG